MKKHNLYYMLILFISIFLLVGVSVLPASNGIFKSDFYKKIERRIVPDNDGAESENSGNFISHIATQEDINKMKEQFGVFDKNKNYNIIYEGHGTGLAPPTENEWDSMVGTVQIVKEIRTTRTLPSAVDLSADPCFPIVGNQRSQGSCGAWAATYYTNGYIQAKEKGWTNASIGDDNQLLSPAFTYNKCNEGGDQGSWMSDNMVVAKTVGAPGLIADTSLDGVEGLRQHLPRAGQHPPRAGQH